MSEKPQLTKEHVEQIFECISISSFYTDDDIMQTIENLKKVGYMKNIDYKDK